MALLITQFRDLPGNPSRDVVPSVSFGYLSPFVLPATDSQFIYHDTTGVFPLSEYWIIGSRPIFSWLITSDHATAPGLVLEIQTSIDGTIWDYWQNFLIVGGGIPSVMEGLHVPGWLCTFSLRNCSAVADVTVSAQIKQQGLT